jgi:hypothetical protein
MNRRLRSSVLKWLMRSNLVTISREPARITQPRLLPVSWSAGIDGKNCTRPNFRQSAAIYSEVKALLGP